MTTESSTGPLTHVTAPNQQHMLLLFLPLKKGTLKEAAKGIGDLISLRHTSAPPAKTDSKEAPGAAAPSDDRAATGVHFAMFYGLAADTLPGAPPPVPSFQTAPGKDLFVVQSIYDADFGPYISAFTSQSAIAAALNLVLSLLDESGIVDPTDPTSAAYILANGGVYKNSNAFIQLLMRYNFSDPTIPGTTSAGINPVQDPKFTLVSTFPGLTVGMILQNFGAQYPFPPVPITFDPSTPPV